MIHALFALSPKDAPALAKLHADALQEAWSEASFREMLAQTGAGGWKLMVDNSLAAFLLLRQTTDEAEILTLITASAYRRQGLARGLLEQSLQQLAEKGCARVYLELRTGNRIARSLYESCGFTLTGQRPRYYPDGEDALVMRRIL